MLSVRVRSCRPDASSVPSVNHSWMTSVSTHLYFYVTAGCKAFSHTEAFFFCCCCVQHLVKLLLVWLGCDPLLVATLTYPPSQDAGFAAICSFCLCCSYISVCPRQEERTTLHPLFHLWYQFAFLSSSFSIEKWKCAPRPISLLTLPSHP